MSSKRHGGPAFPELGNIGHNSEWQNENGMSLRDYFAAHCPITMQQAWNTWSAQPESDLLAVGFERAGFFEWWAMLRYEYADAMVEAGFK